MRVAMWSMHGHISHQQVMLKVIRRLITVRRRRTLSFREQDRIFKPNSGYQQQPQYGYAQQPQVIYAQQPQMMYAQQPPQQVVVVEERNNGPSGNDAALGCCAAW